MKFAQTDVSAGRNRSFFRDHLEEYSSSIKNLDTYRNIRSAIEEEIRGSDSLLDVGNGGVFDYDTQLSRQIVGIDLFLDSLPSSFYYPSNVTLRTGSALDLPEGDESFDTVLMCMLIHHLVGETVTQSVSNARRAFAEAYRVLRPGGKLVVIESCVPGWFYRLERAIFPIVSRIVDASIAHPTTLQHTIQALAAMLEQETNQVAKVKKINLGKWVLQFGVKVPSVLTPVTPYRVVISKPF